MNHCGPMHFRVWEVLIENLKEPSESCIPRKIGQKIRKDPFVFFLLLLWFAGLAIIQCYHSMPPSNATIQRHRLMSNFKFETWRGSFLAYSQTTFWKAQRSLAERGKRTGSRQRDQLSHGALLNDCNDKFWKIIFCHSKLIVFKGFLHGSPKGFLKGSLWEPVIVSSQFVSLFDLQPKRSSFLNYSNATAPKWKIVEDANRPIGLRSVTCPPPNLPLANLDMKYILL